jgi:hypothetical protein
LGCQIEESHQQLERVVLERFARWGYNI